MKSRYFLSGNEIAPSREKIIHSVLIISVPKHIDIELFPAIIKATVPKQLRMYRQTLSEKGKGNVRRNET